MQDVDGTCSSGTWNGWVASSQLAAGEYPLALYQARCIVCIVRSAVCVRTKNSLVKDEEAVVDSGHDCLVDGQPKQSKATLFR